MTNQPAFRIHSPAYFLTRPRVALLLWALFALNAGLRLATHHYHAIGHLVGLSIVVGLGWLARKYRLPALTYFAAAGIATAIFLLGLDLGRDLARHPAASLAQHQPAATK